LVRTTRSKSANVSSSTGRVTSVPALLTSTVQPAELRRHSPDGLLGLRLVADFQGQGQAARPSLAQPRRGGLGQVGPQVGGRHECPRPGERPAGGLAQAPPRPRHQGDLPAQVLHAITSLPVFWSAGIHPRFLFRPNTNEDERKRG
jgi:hypothetical protein